MAGATDSVIGVGKDAAIAGFLTQLAAALIILAMIYEIVRPEPENLRLKILLIAALGSLALLGPGLFSIDLPL